jgi:hypothetical protein
MARIAQGQLFGWEEVEELGDLERLRLVLRSLPDEALMRHLESDQGHGRDDYPVRAVWNSVLAVGVYQHDSVESLRRELQRNGQLRQRCGFDPVKGARAVPPPWAYTRFLRALIEHAEEIEKVFDELVEKLRGEWPGFGRTLAVDGKAIRTHGRPGPKDQKRVRDGRRDLDADWGKKTHSEGREDGTLWETVVKWFGYKRHLVVEAEYELPVAYEVTTASAGEAPVAPKLAKRLKERHSEVFRACEAWLGDRGYDDGKFIEELWDEHEIKPVIAIRDMWKDGEETRRVTGTRNVVYDFQGTVSCHCPKTGEGRRMAYGGFEQTRGTLKYRCPASHYGVDCAGATRCEVGQAVRIPMEKARRIFTPPARSSYAWKDLYKKRTAVERVNSRLDVSFGFEEHFIRGRAKMKVRVGLALIVMLAMALGRVKEKQDAWRSLVRAA